MGGEEDTSGDVEAVVRRYALANAAQHRGKANPKAVLGKLMAEQPALRSRAAELKPLVERVAAEVEAMDEEAQRAAVAAEAPELLERKPREAPKQALPDLPNAEAGKVVMRFAPNPSGPLTFGHARGVVLHLAYVERYRARLILRYDDTDPDVKPPLPEAYAWQAEDLAWLGGKPDETLVASDRVPLYYEHAVRGLREGALYVCACAPEAFRDLKNQGQACPHRGLPPEDQLAAWDAMLDGTTPPGGAAVRVKTDLQSRNPAWREWVALRIVENPHPRPGVGGRYRVWPVLDFQSAVDDHLSGVTHILRGKDLADSGHKQRYLYRHFGWQYPEVMHWGRVKMHEFGKFSKSLLTEAIAKGEFTGWDDPRLPTLKAMRRRGFQPEAVKAFWLSLGLSERDVSASLQTLEAMNRERIDARADRFFFLAAPVHVPLAAGPEVEGRPPLHPDFPDRGARRLRLSPAEGFLLSRATLDELAGGREVVDAQAKPGGAEARVVQPREAGEKPFVVRLKDTANLRVAFVDPGAAARARDCEARGLPAHVEAVNLEVEVLGAAVDAGGGAPQRIVEWLPAHGGAVAPCEVLTPEGPERGLVERVLLERKRAGDMVQFERYGYCRVEALDPASGSARLVFTHG